MVLNKEIIKSPLPVWVIIVCSILSGVFFSLISVMIFYGWDLAQLALFFALGVTGYIYIFGIYTLAKKTTPWLRRNFGLIVKIGAAISAALILWSILSKK